MGRSPFGGAFEELQAHLKESHKKNIIVVNHGPYRDGMNLRQSNLLFISNSEKKNMVAIINNLHTTPVLTVSDMDGFLEAGGMICLIVCNNKVRWAINRIALNTAGLKLNAKLLQLALQIKNNYNESKSQNHDPAADHDPWHLPPKASAGYPAWRLRPLC